MTAEDLARLPDPGCSELVKGRLVCKSPTFVNHARVELNFAHELLSFVRPRDLGQVLVGEVGIFTGRNPDTIRGADVAFISKERFAQCSGKQGFLEVAPDLIVEVLSLSERPKKLREKLAEYFSMGVKRVWIADLARRGVRVHRSVGEVCVLESQDTLEGEDVLPGFSIRVQDLFR